MMKGIHRLLSYFRYVVVVIKIIIIFYLELIKRRPDDVIPVSSLSSDIEQERIFWWHVLYIIECTADFDYNSPVALSVWTEHSA